MDDDLDPVSLALSVAAPDMLVALRYDLMVLDDAHAEPEKVRCALALTKAAIAKAEGGAMK